MKECVRKEFIYFQINFLFKNKNLQKINEDIFHELKITNEGDVDMEATFKLFDNTFSDKIWSQSFKSAAEICFKEVTVNFAAIQSKFEAEPFNLKKEDCNVKFMAIHSCVSLETVIVS